MQFNEITIYINNFMGTSILFLQINEYLSILIIFFIYKKIGFF